VIRLFPLLLLLAAFSCGPSSEDRAAGPAIVKRYSVEPVELTVSVDRDRLDVSETVELALEATAPEEQEVRFPVLPDKLGGFSVLESREASPLLVGDGQILRRETYVLEPFLPGDYEIPPLTIGIGEDRSIETEPMQVVVESLLKEGEEKPEIKDIAPPVSLPGLNPWIYVGIAVLLIAAGLTYWWKKLRRKRAPVETQPQPHEIALRALRELMNEDLITKGQAKLFYLKVSAILRRYIEGRFGLQAPESTTEEFLNDLRDDQSFSERQKELLRQFLVHCDLVKFAGHQPVREEIDDTINTCAQFIAETKPQESAVQPGTGGGS